MRSLTIHMFIPFAVQFPRPKLTGYNSPKNFRFTQVVLKCLILYVGGIGHMQRKLLNVWNMKGRMAMNKYPEVLSMRVCTDFRFAQ